MNTQDYNPNPVQDDYYQNQVFTASREELILLLYQGAQRFIRQGLQQREAQNWAAMGWNLVRAEKIVHYLNLCLDLKAGGQLAKNLESLYLYLHHRLTQGHLERNQAALEECLGVIKSLSEAWETSLIKSKEQALAH